GGRPGPTARAAAGSRAAGAVRAQGGVVNPWLGAGIGAALAAALIAAALVARTRGPVAEEVVEAAAPLSAEPGAEVDLDHLLADPDPRRAVIAAYAGMERTMAVGGAGRRAPEAPLEYLSRLRGTRAAVAPMADRLTALYQRARLGRAPISPAMRDDAAAAPRALPEAEGSGGQGARGRWASGSPSSPSGPASSPAPTTRRRRRPRSSSASGSRPSPCSRARSAEACRWPDAPRSTSGPHRRRAAGRRSS